MLDLRPLHNVVWNLLLAIIPVVLALTVYRGVREQSRSGKVVWALWAPLLAMWFFFIPNTCYLFTEWRHYLSNVAHIPAAYFEKSVDPLFMMRFMIVTAFYFFYTGSGLFCFCLSVYPLDTLFKMPWICRPVFFFFCSVGVYLGLVDRFNSWQIVRHPHTIIRSAHAAIENSQIAALIIGYALMLWSLYSLFELGVDGLRLRFPKLELLAPRKQLSSARAESSV